MGGRRREHEDRHCTAARAPQTRAIVGPSKRANTREGNRERVGAVTSWTVSSGCPHEWSERQLVAATRGPSDASTDARIFEADGTTALKHADVSAETLRRSAERNVVVSEGHYFSDQPRNSGGSSRRRRSCGRATARARRSARQLALHRRARSSAVQASEHSWGNGGRCVDRALDVRWAVVRTSGASGNSSPPRAGQAMLRPAPASSKPTAPRH